MAEQERDELGRFAGDGSSATDKAMQATAATYRRGNPQEHIESNLAAAQSHLEAAAVHMKNGDHDKARLHIQQAKAHREAAGSTLKKWAKRKLK